MSTATLEAPPPLRSSFTSTGEKLFAHQEAMYRLRNGQGTPIVTHVMPTDVCQASCAFCSVHNRPTNVLPMEDILAYLNILEPLGLKAVIISGGGNPLLYRSPNTQWGISELILAIHSMGLEIGMITNGMKLRDVRGRRTYATLSLEALDALTWLRVSMAGLDHEENTVFVPDVNPDKTTLGFSYVLHDIYDCPEDSKHGKVSTLEDLVTLGAPVRGVRYGSDRIPELTRQITGIVREHRPAYTRLLPNCLEISRIEGRCEELRGLAADVNDAVGYEACFVQYKPPKAPRACFMWGPHPVLNSCGGVFPCDSVVLNKAAGHKFASPWRLCHWSEVASLYDRPVKTPFDPKVLCPGCVFEKQATLLADIVDGGAIPPAPVGLVHPNFV